MSKTANRVVVYLSDKTKKRNDQLNDVLDVLSDDCLNPRSIRKTKEEVTIQRKPRSKL